jgi:hypothetical protein
MILNVYLLKKKLGNFFISLSLLIAGALVALLAGELWIRLYKPQPFFVPLASARFDKDTGIPKKAATHNESAHEEFNADLQTNTLGFHDIEHTIGPHPNTYRIVILGDSFTEANQLPLKDTWYRQLEALLQKRVDKKIEIISLGIGGAGTGWELLIFEKLGMLYEPDLVILAFHPGSDFFNNHPRLETKFDKPFFIIRNEKISLIDYSKMEIYVKKIWLPLWRISHLYRYLNRSLYKISEVSKNIRNGMPIFFEPYLVNPPIEWDEAEGYTQFYLSKIQALCIKKNCPLVVASIPDSYRIYDDQWLELKRKYPVMLNKKWDMDAPVKRLSRILSKLDIPLIDLTPFIHKKAVSMERLYFKKDIHWNLLGNRVVAEAISENIIRYIK